MGKHALFILVCLYCVAAFATGDNTHGQGVRFAGLGFDEQQPLQPSQWVPWFGSSWPPQSGTYNSIGGARQIRVEANCEPDPVPDTLFALCYGTVRDVSSGKSISACDSKAAHRSGRRAFAAAPQKGSVPLLAIRGKWNTTTNAFERDSEVLTFACAPKFDENPPRRLSEVPLPFTGDPSDMRMTNLDDSPDLGVLAKCYFWGFAQRKQTEDSRFATYQACLRAARAEYCGRGISQTESGTIIQVYEPKETQVGQPPNVILDKPFCASPKNPKSSRIVMKRAPLGFTPCFEALWDSNGAICVSHARYLEMPVQDCKNNFQQAFSAIVEGGELVRVSPVPKDTTERVFLHCSVNDYFGAVQRARIKNRSGINSLDGGVKGCTNDIPCP